MGSLIGFAVIEELQNPNPKEPSKEPLNKNRNASIRRVTLLEPCMGNRRLGFGLEGELREAFDFRKPEDSAI